MIKQLSPVLQRRSYPSLAGVGAAALLLALAIAWYLLPLGEWLLGLRDWIVGLGLPGVAIFILVYIVGTVVLAPAGVLTLIAGFAYGFWGLPIVIVAATTGAALAFLIARHAGRERVRRLLWRRPNLAAIDRAVAEDGWKIVALLRLSPAVPFNLQNYLFGLTAIPFAHFVAATFAGIIPVTTLFIYIGALGSTSGEVGPIKWGFLAAGLAATVVVAVLVARKAKAKLAAAGIAAVARDD